MSALFPLYLCGRNAAEWVICMKKVIFGGLLFIGGAIMYSVGTLGFADMDVQANYMLMPQYIGIATMIIGAALGFFGLKKD